MQVANHKWLFFYCIIIIEYNYPIPNQVCDLKSFYEDLNNALLKIEKLIK